MHSRGVGELIVEQDRAKSIVNTSSIAGFKAGPCLILYCTSKAALDIVTRNMALELGPHNIRVNSLNPDVLSTRMTLNSSLRSTGF